LLNDRELPDRLSQAAYEVAAERFDIAENARNLAELFNAVR
jgi:glycosyltransferase involved in cell wall biosynthesis